MHLPENLGPSAAHDHGSPRRTRGDARLLAAIAINGLLTVAQIVGGAVSGSLALVADALHNLSDAGSLTVALVARRIARRPTSKVQTFGHQRVELVGALINATTLVVIGLFLIYEAAIRLFRPQEVGGWVVVAVAGVALLVDLLTALLTYALARGNLNVRAAFVHNITDALGSLAVIVSGTLIIVYDLTVADVIATLLIAAYAIWQGARMARQAVRILTLGAPPDVDLDDLVGRVREVAGVLDIHHVHLWQLDERNVSFEAHIVVPARDDAMVFERTKCAVKDVLEARGIHHSTLELECDGAGRCQDRDFLAPHG